MIYNSVKIVEEGVVYYVGYRVFYEFLDEKVENFLKLPYFKKVELSDVVINAKTDSRIKCRYLLEDCFDSLFDSERQPLQKFSA